MQTSLKGLTAMKIQSEIRLSKAMQRKINSLCVGQVIHSLYNQEAYYSGYNGQPKRVLFADCPARIINPMQPYIRNHVDRKGKIFDVFCLVEYFDQNTQHIERASLDYCDIKELQ